MSLNNISLKNSGHLIEAFQNQNCTILERAERHFIDT
jgi:hypothetical protein